MHEGRRPAGASDLGWILAAVAAVLTAVVWVVVPALGHTESPAAASDDAATHSSAEVMVLPPLPEPAGRPERSAGNDTLVDRAWAQALAANTGIPFRALLGYAGAEIAMRAEQPGCGIRWATLAALGYIESGHGTHAGAAIDSTGMTVPGVWGPELDGRATALIPDSDAGAIDGLSTGDRAVGPLQFIPQTWSQWGADGSGDGIADPQQIDDASLAAARYLCHYGDLTDATTWRTAIFAYNHLEEYVDDVAARAAIYAQRASG